MIQFVSAYIKTIVSFLLISVLVEIIMPDGYKKFSKLVMGLMLTVCVLQPFSYFFGLSTEQLSGIIDRRTEELWSLDEVISYEMDESLSEEIFKTSLEESICADAGVSSATVIIDKEETYGKILEIKLYAQQKGDDDKKKAAYISGKYDVMQKNIEYIYQ